MKQETKKLSSMRAEIDVNETLQQNMYFDLMCYEKWGSEFQSFFERLMKHLDEDFIPIKPHGSEGDWKCDGLSPRTGRFFQVYAPEKENEAKAISKAERDLKGALEKYGGRLKEWVFVYGHFRLYPRFEQAIHKLSQEYNIRIATWTNVDIWKQLERISRDDRIAVLQIPGELLNSDLAMIREIHEAVVTKPSRSEKRFKFTYEAQPASTEDPGPMKYALDRCPTNWDDLVNYFTLIKDRVRRCRLIEEYVYFAMVRKDARTQFLIALFEKECNGETPLFRAMDHLLNRDFVSAIKELRNASADICTRLRHVLLNNLAVAIVQQPPPDARMEAKSLLEQALALKREDPVIWRNWGRWLMDRWLKTGSPALKVESINALEEALEIDPSYAAAHVTIGAINFTLGNYEIAVNRFKRALTYDPFNLKALSNLGLVLKRMGLREMDRGLLEEAREYLELALGIKPDYDMAWGGLGDVQLELGNLEAAEHAYKKALQYQDVPKLYAALLSNLGVVYQRLQRLDEAEETYQEAIRAQPRFTNAHYNLGIVLMIKGDLDGAIEAYQLAIKAVPTNISAWYNLAYVLEQKGHYDEAIDAYRNATKTDSTHFKAYARLGRLMSMESDFKRAEDAFRSALRLDPSDPRLWHEIVILLRKTHRNEIDLSEYGMNIVSLEQAKEFAERFDEAPDKFEWSASESEGSTDPFDELGGFLLKAKVSKSQLADVEPSIAPVRLEFPQLRIETRKTATRSPMEFFVEFRVNVAAGSTTDMVSRGAEALQRHLEEHGIRLLIHKKL